MKKTIIFLVVFLSSAVVFSYEEPIFSIHNVPAGYNYTVKDFSVYQYSENRLEGYARLYYGGLLWREFVKLSFSLFKNGSMVASDFSYLTYETYGDYGMWPGSESFIYYYFDKVDFDSVLFITSYTSRSGEPKFNKNAIAVISTAIKPPTYGTKSTISGIVQNLSGVPLKFPKVIICFYRNDKMLLFDYTYAQAPDYSLDPLEMATFEFYINIPAQYDSIKFLPNYDITLTGDIIISDIAKIGSESLIEEFSLSQNYPNPFNASTTLQFFIDHPQRIKIEIYDLMGKIALNVFDGILSEGYHSVTINAGELASGSYFYVLTGEKQRLTKKMTILK